MVLCALEIHFPLWIHESVLELIMPINLNNWRGFFVALELPQKSHILNTQDINESICDVALFCPQGVAVAVSRAVALLWEIILESNSRSSKFALLRYLRMLVANCR